MTFQWKSLACAADDGLPQERWGATLTGAEMNQVGPTAFHTESVILVITSAMLKHSIEMSSHTNNCRMLS